MLDAIDHHDELSKTPASKAILVRIVSGRDDAFGSAKIEAVAE